MKKILITGKNSYIGNSFKEWVSQWPDKYQVDEVETRDDLWKRKNFAGYDSILHVAGIAHIKETKKNRDLYYKVNRDLAVDVAQKAKKEGVKQFIFLSTMSVYGLTTGVIDKDTPLNPKNAYGKSKLEAEKIIKEMQNDSFSVAIVRPPMVYGKNSKGNYGKLSMLAKRTPIFPQVNNKRSMIYIDNLSNFIRTLVDSVDVGTFHPQNKEYVNISEMVRMISEIHGKKIVMTNLFNPFINMININLFVKVFGSLIYEKKLTKNSEHYNVEKFEKTLIKTEESK